MATTESIINTFIEVIDRKGINIPNEEEEQLKACPEIKQVH